SATANEPADFRIGTVGRPVDDCEIKLDADGEILIHSDSIFAGYYKDPEATAAVLSDDGWFRTGDVGEIDADGFLKITDRKKDLIINAGGKYVAPQPLEAQLQDEPIIERAVVIGDDRPYCVALIVPDWQAVNSELRLNADPKPRVD